MREQDHPGRLVVMVIDLDNFKKLNDTHGHSVGDEALVGVAAALRATCRRTAVIGRAGGEEFVVADIGDPAEHAVTAERLRAAIAANPLQITASIGTATAPAGAVHEGQRRSDRESHPPGRSRHVRRQARGQEPGAPQRRRPHSRPVGLQGHV